MEFMLAMFSSVCLFSNNGIKLICVQFGVEMYFQIIHISIVCVMYSVMSQF
jgi:hypothetical protein